jgi:hypothetical protein
MSTTDNPCASPAWLGYKVDLSTGELIWEVCAWCLPVEKHRVEAEAERLDIRASHGICPTCYAREMGETLPGIMSDKPTA